MKDKQNDWDQYSSDADKRSDSVYNEKEIAYLDKYGAMAKNAIDDSELYDLIIEFDFNDDKIEKALQAKLKYIEAKGEEYGWKKITGKGKAYTDQTNAKHSRPKYKQQHQQEAYHSSGKEEGDNNNYKPHSIRNSNNAYYGEKYYKERPTGPQYGDTSSGYSNYGNNSYNSSYYNSNNNSKHYRWNSNYNAYNDKAKKKKRPFEECYEVPPDYKPNTNTNANTNVNANANANANDANEFQEKEKEKPSSIVNPESKRIQIEPHQYNHEEESKHEEDPFKEFNSLQAQYKPKIEYNTIRNNNDTNYNDGNNNNKDEREDDIDKKEDIQNELRLYLNKLKNYTLQEPKKKSALAKLTEEQQKEEGKGKYHSHHFEIETMNQYTSVRKQEHKQIEKKRNYVQTSVESILINACYDTPNRAGLIANIKGNNTQSQMKTTLSPIDGYIPMMNMNMGMNMAQQCYPPFIYPFPYIPPIQPQTQDQRMPLDKQPEPNANPSPINPYPYPMFIPMYPNTPQHFFEAKTNKDPIQDQTGQRPK